MLSEHCDFSLHKLKAERARAISCPLAEKQQGQACVCHGYWKLMGAVTPHVASKC